jgi:hypothetical protein
MGGMAQHVARSGTGAMLTCGGVLFRQPRSYLATSALAKTMDRAPSKVFAIPILGISKNLLHHQLPILKLSKEAVHRNR